MKISLNNKKLHLSYCMNIHPGNSWQESFAAIKNSIPEIKKEFVAADEYFALGLRLSATAVQELSDKPDELALLKEHCFENNYYPFSINVFPYGEFHRKIVKDNVYLPAWDSPERLEYTINSAKILAELLDNKTQYGSLSTVPIGYRSHFNEEKMQAAMENLSKIIIEFEKIEEKTGKLIKLALEPEPGCIMDSNKSIAKFFNEKLRRHCKLPIDLQNRYIGLCLDTCHQAVLFESVAETMKLLRKNQIPLAKLQISAAPIFNKQKLEEAKAFLDPVYLHQSAVKAEGNNDKIKYFEDLTDAIKYAEITENAELRTHFHIPLTVEDSNKMGSTTKLLDKNFLEELQKSDTEQIEVETYTFAVLPEFLKKQKLEKSITQELQKTINILKSGEWRVESGEF